MAENGGISDSNYKSTPNFPAYRLTTTGKLLTCWSRGQPRRLTDSWREVVPDVGKRGHRRITLYERGKRLRVLLHRLMLEVFIGPCPEGMEACHEDGNPANNRLDNLRWDSPQGNWKDRKRHGRGGEGVKQSQAKLDEDAVRDIRRRRKDGVKLRILAEEYGVSTAKISQVALRKNWSHVDG